MNDYETRAEFVLEQVYGIQLPEDTGKLNELIERRSIKVYYEKDMMGLSHLYVVASGEVPVELDFFGRPELEEQYKEWKKQRRKIGRVEKKDDVVPSVDVLMKVFRIFDKHGLIRNDLCFDPEHFMETVVRVHWNDYDNEGNIRS